MEGFESIQELTKALEDLNGVLLQQLELMKCLRGYHQLQARGEDVAIQPSIAERLVEDALENYGGLRHTINKEETRKVGIPVPPGYEIHADMFLNEVREGLVKIGLA